MGIGIIVDQSQGIFPFFFFLTLSLFKIICFGFIQGFDELLLLAEKGDHRHVDLLVRDIYGGDNTKSLGLPPDIIASSFGKVCHKRDNRTYPKHYSNSHLIQSRILYLCCIFIFIIFQRMV